MADLKTQRFALPTGVELDVTLGGDPVHEAVFFLHGFPESHRTWRHQLPVLAEDHFVVAPDQRGFVRSSKPAEVSDYTPDHTVADLIALADALGVERFTLVGHDWGGAIAWMAALRHPERVARLVIVNAPHPFLFQKTLFDDMDQRAASQYIRAFRDPALEAMIGQQGLEWFFDKSFMRHLDEKSVTAEDRAAYLEEWAEPGALTAMFNWYRASAIVVPAMDETPDRPAFLDGPFPVLHMPVLVIWGMGDKALLPSQLDGLDALCADLEIAKVDSGHFVPWENPDAVTRALKDFLKARVTA